GPGDPSAQARQVFDNLRRCPAAAGLSFGGGIKATYYLTGGAPLPAVPAVRGEVVDTGRPPAGTAVRGVGRGRPRALLEGGRRSRWPGTGASGIWRVRGVRRRADEVQSRWHPDHRLVRRRDPAAAPEDDRQRSPE